MRVAVRISPCCGAVCHETTAETFETLLGVELRVHAATYSVCPACGADVCARAGAFVPEVG